MSKNRNSIKGEYGIGYSRNTAEVRDFQELLDSRLAGLNNMEARNYHEHKMEFVKNIRGVDFVNDSACTNLNGIFMALSDATKQVTWITSFTNWSDIELNLLQLIVEKVNNIIFFGDNNEESRIFFDALNINHDWCNDLETAVRIAFYSTPAGDEILFSPGIPADAQFNDSTAERGTQFKKAVAQL